MNLTTMYDTLCRFSLVPHFTLSLVQCSLQS